MFWKFWGDLTSGILHKIKSTASESKEEYEYTEEGVIIMSTSLNGVTVYAEFEREVEVEEE
mgnify:CR=1 FL=1